MKIRKDQIISLWEQRISAYIHKKSIETRKLILFLGMFMFLISGDAQFGKNVTVFMGLGYGIYITLHSLITRKIKKLSSLQLKEEKERTFKVLLLSVQNWSFVGVLTGTSWLAGGLGVKQMLGDIFNNRTLSFSLISLFILASVFFPFILHNKAKEKKKDILIARQLVSEIRYGHLVNFSQFIMKQDPEVITSLSDFAGSLSKVVEIVKKYK